MDIGKLPWMKKIEKRQLLHVIKGYLSSMSCPLAFLMHRLYFKNLCQSSYKVVITLHSLLR